MNKTERKNSNKKRIVMFLLMISLLVTSGTFAYWASYVEGTSEEAVGTLTVGSAEGVNTTFALSNELNSGGLLVPATQVRNSTIGSVSEITISHDLKWKEDEKISQLEGTTTEGDVSVGHTLSIYQDTELLSLEKYSYIYDLIHVTYDEENPSTMILDKDAETFSYVVTMDEPKDQHEYQLISESEIYITFHYRIFDNFIETKDNVTSEPVSNPAPEVEPEPLVDRMVLEGDEVMYLEINTQYVEPGYNAYNEDGDLVELKWFRGGVNIGRLGEYTIMYTAFEYNNGVTIYTAERKVIVVDTTAPELTINGDQEFEHTLGWNYTDYGAWAKDNSGEAIEVTVSGLEEIDSNQPGTYYVTYTAVDSSGNISTATRTVIIK